MKSSLEKIILTLGSKGKTVLRDPCSTFTLLELLFARIYGHKIAQLCVENLKKIFYRTVPLGHINNSE